MLRKLGDLRGDAADRFASELSGINIRAIDGEKLGTVSDALVDENDNLDYLIVDAGWLSTRHFLIPADEAFAEANSDEFIVNMRKEDVERLPEFRDEFLSDADRFGGWQREYRSVWRYTSERATGTRPERLGRFRESLRPRRAAVVETPRVGATRHATSVYGAYAERAELERAIGELKELGFRNDDISVLFPERDKTHRFAVEHATKAPEGALAGGSTGLVVGGVLGWLAGIGMLAIPGVGPILAAGPIVAAITGAGVGSAIGGLAGALIGLGVPELEAKRYEEHVKRGGILLSVHCGDLRFAESARRVLEHTGAKDIFMSGERPTA